MTRIKICGITTIKEIEFLNRIDIDYLGFVFAESKRKISMNRFNLLDKYITSDVKRVGVFRNNSIDKVLKVIENCNLDIVQLHGDETMDFICKIKKRGFTGEIWKAISDFKTLNRDVLTVVDKVLMDGVNPGEGKCFEWSSAENIKWKKPVFLAGGINLDNVQLGIKRFAPYGIDLSSSVEGINDDGKREKDREKVINLVRKVREYDKR